jgi:hypothetical protein
MNLGLLVTHDGVKFEEPIPDFKMIYSIEEGWTNDRPEGFPPRLAQGQGMVNVGDRTLAYYSHWGRGDKPGILVALWDKDRLGYYAPSTDPEEGQWMYPDVPSHFISCPIQLNKRGGRLFINAAKVSDLGYITVEILDREFRPIKGYTAGDSTPIKNGGFRQGVAWKDHDKLEGFDGPIRVRVIWNGVRPEDPRVYAVYVTNGD